MPDQTIRTIALRSIGCRTNQQELDTLAAQLRQAGFCVVSEISAADAVVVNTCCVTAVAEAKSRRAVARIAREVPRARVLVTGCSAQRAPLSFGSRDNVDWVVSNGFKNRIPDMLRREPGVYHAPPSAEPLAAGPVAGGRSSAGFRTRSALKVQEGCDHACSYCIVPSVRGPSRSVPMDTVRTAFEGMVRAGAREIVLTGTHIGQYADEASVWQDS